MNNAHLVVVNNDTFAIHMQNQFCAFKAAEGLGHWGQLADLMSVRRGDLIFFYLNYISEKNLLYPLNKFLPATTESIAFQAILLSRKRMYSDMVSLTDKRYSETRHLKNTRNSSVMINGCFCCHCDLKLSP